MTYLWAAGAFAVLFGELKVVSSQARTKSWPDALHWLRGSLLHVGGRGCTLDRFNLFNKDDGLRGPRRQHEAAATSLNPKRIR